MILNPEPSIEDKLHLIELKRLLSELKDESFRKIALTFDDEILIMFLRCRKYNFLSAVERICWIIELSRTDYPSEFKKMYPEELKHVLENRRFYEVVKNPDQEGSRVLIYRNTFWDTEKTSVDDVIRGVSLVSTEVILRDRAIQERGVVIIWDATDMTFKQLLTVTPQLLYKWAKIIAKGFPGRIKAFHFYNGPRVLNYTMNIVKLTLSKKLQNRVIVHGSSLKSLHKHVSKDILYKYYGGPLTEEEALDTTIVDGLLKKERGELYKKLYTSKFE